MRASALTLALLSLACGAEDPGDDLATCVPGEQRACACPGGGPPGAQVCAAGGDQFGMCFGCPADDDTGAPITTSGDAPTTTGEPGTTTGVSASGSNDGTSSESGDDPPLPGEPSGPPQTVPPAPPPDGYSIVEQVALEHPDWLKNSCLDFGGNNDFMYEVVRRLRMQDDRWGLNWKRGVVGDLSQDVVDYHYGDGVSEGSTDVYIIDMIVGHCGDNPQAGWIDVTQATLDAGTIGMWTLNGQDL
jgi:hypothetical protein